ncbi:MAG TPA: amylo-alpha-1,6-glucosidase [Chthoniobacterales bacterium]|nr:amylo-alpha-1,6-glucosidase [Chthoniobacterales bacterium]
MSSQVQDVITVGDQHYVRARSSFADDRRRVLMSGDTFAVFDRWGDFQSIGAGEFGLFHCDTRYLSRFELRINGQRPLLLSSTIREDNGLLAVDLTNPELQSGDQVIRHGTIHIYRTKFLRQAYCFERITIDNYGKEAIELTLSIQFNSDFADIFEVRGSPRSRRGRLLEEVPVEKGIQMLYEGLDKLIRTTTLRVSGPAARITAREVRSVMRLEPAAIDEISISVECRESTEPSYPVRLDVAREEMEQGIAVEAGVGCDIYTDNEQFNDWVNRSKADLQMLTNETGYGPYPYAGVPWYSTVFGRDGIITAFQTLWMKPQIAAGVLRFLAKTQAKVDDPTTNAQPGKIVHEIRKCEMARLGEVPFRQYYGTVDATPLFLLLAAAYFERTNDLALIREIWPNIELGLSWIDHYGDADQDGFVEYSTQSRGLKNQGWKDSADAVFHADGSLAEGPIALCEVQAYIFAAKKGLAKAALGLVKPELAERLTGEASRLSENFQRAFWSDPIGMYALALDGEKRQCEVRSSNGGQCLFSGIGDTEANSRMIAELGKPEFFSGWGIRTIASSEKGFNPMSYHNGSIWPHDNSLVALGAARHGRKDLTRRILTGLFDAAIFFELHRLPELFCGFPRRPQKAPTLYPVACSPQAWAAGSVFLLLQSCLGLKISGENSQIVFQYPSLPQSIKEVRLNNLSVGNGSVDLLLTRDHEAVSLGITKRTGKVEVITIC